MGIDPGPGWLGRWQAERQLRVREFGRPPDPWVGVALGLGAGQGTQILSSGWGPPGTPGMLSASGPTCPAES